MYVLLSNRKERSLQNSYRRKEQTCFSAQRSTAVQNQSLYSLSFVLFGLLRLSLCQRQQSLDNSCIKIFKNLLIFLLIIVVISFFVKLIRNKLTQKSKYLLRWISGRVCSESGCFSWRELQWETRCWGTKSSDCCWGGLLIWTGVMMVWWLGCQICSFSKSHRLQRSWQLNHESCWGCCSFRKSHWF